MSRLAFYLIRCGSILSSCVVSLVRFDFRRFRQAIKEILIAIFAYVRDRSCKLRNFTESEFYRTRRENFCWTAISMYPHIWLNTRITEVSYLALHDHRFGYTLYFRVRDLQQLLHGTHGAQRG